MAKTRKVTQIAVGGEGSADLFVLCDDQTVWKRIAVRKGGNIVDWVWEQIKVNLPAAQ